MVSKTLCVLTAYFFAVVLVCIADVADVVVGARRTLGQRAERVEVCVQRHMAWRIVSLSYTYTSIEDLTDLELDRIAALTTLDTLRLTGRWGLLDERSPLSAGALHKLGRLHLRQLVFPCRMSEAQMNAVCSLADLEELDVPVDYAVDKETKGEGLIYLGRLRNLRRLDLSNVGLSDASLEHLRPLRSLEELNLRGNRRITDAGIARLKGFDSLRSLVVDRLGAAGLSALKDVPRLEELNVTTYDPGQGKADLSVLRGLRRLRVYNVSSALPGDLRLPEGLRLLELPYRTVGALDLKTAGRIERVGLGLESYDVRRRRAKDLTWLGSLPALRDLMLTDALDSDVRAVARLASLRSLSVVPPCPVPLGKEAMKAIAGLQHLESLEVQGNGWTAGIIRNGGTVGDDDMAALRQLSKLRHLDLRGFPEVSPKGLDFVWDLKELRTLTLDLSAEIIADSTAAVLGHLESLSKLEELCLQGTVTDVALNKLATVKKLRRLDLTSAEGYTDAGLATLMRTLPELETLKFTIKKNLRSGQTKN
jgi:hypothetical protein